MSGESPRDPSTDALLKTALGETLRPPSAACVDAETLAAWAEGALATADSARVEAHIASCTRCQAMAAAFAQTETARVAAPANVMPMPVRSRAWRWVVPASAAAAATLLWIVVPRERGAAPATQTMARVEVEPPAALPPAAPAPAETGRTTPADTVRRDQTAAAGNAAKTTPLAEPRERRQETATSSTATADASVLAPDTSRFGNPSAVERSPATEASALPSPVVVAPPPPPGPPLPAAPVRQVLPGAGVTAGRGGARQNAAGNRNMDAVGEVQVTANGFPPELLEVVSSRAPASDAPSGRAVLRDLATRTETRWRVSNRRIVQRSFNGGRSWDVVSVDAPSAILAGSAPDPSVCWFVGEDGLVLITTDAERFSLVAFPERVGLTFVSATSATRATVRTADGRTFTTADGGATWRRE